VVSETPCFDELRKPLRELGGDDGDARTGLEQQGDPALGHDTAADDEDGTLF
jgi:hypothetical protein